MASIDSVPKSKFSCLPVDKFVAYILPSTTTWSGTITYGNNFLYSCHHFGVNFIIDSWTSAHVQF